MNRAYYLYPGLAQKSAKPNWKIVGGALYHTKVGVQGSITKLFAEP